jgi:hypothetical protein
MTDSYGIIPGLTTSRETYENEFRWGSQYQGVFANALIDGAARDSGNSPTYELRPGLLLGQVLSTGKYIQYSPTATNGSEVASGILIEGLRTQDFSGNDADRFYAVLVGGPVRATKVLNLDLMARQQMDKFIFDDIGNVMGNHWWPFKRFQTKTAAYTVVASDNHTLFDNVGATAAVTFTLPVLANGYFFGFRVQADQNVTVASNEGDNMIAFNDVSADSVAFSTGGSLIGGMVWVYTNPGATKWIVEDHSAGANTITVAT